MVGIFEYLLGPKALARKLLGDSGGNIAVILGFSLIPIMGGVGVAVDSSLAFMVEDRLQKSLDAAGLAAGRALFTGNVSEDAQAFLEANFNGANPNAVASISQFNIEIDADQEFVTLSATASMPTKFMSIFGFDALTISARAVIQRQNKGMELALVMDNTGSMRSGGKIDAMKSAAQDLIDIVYGNNETLPNLWVGLVPYTAAVNVGSVHSDWLAGSDPYFDNPDPFDPTNWKGCVEARAEPFDQDDSPPGVESFDSFFYAAADDNEWTDDDVDESNGAKNNGYGPNLGCGPSITPLVAEKSVVSAAISEMLPWHRGGTTGNLGLSWGWRVVSPNWRGLWQGIASPALPLPYNEPLMEKVVVMLTDGQNQFYDWPGNGPGPDGSDYTAYGRLADFGYATLNDARQELDARFANSCGLMKQEGIIIFAITFGSTPSSNTQDLYRACATEPSKYFHAPDSATLTAAFRAIAQQLSNLRIAE